MNARAIHRSGVVVCAAVVSLLAASGLAQDPATLGNGDAITLSGTILSTTPDSFRLDYGKGIVTVEMDDMDWYQEGRKLIVNDRVTVYGRLDKDAYEKKKIEAGSVYVENLGTYFHASDADEEDLSLWTVGRPVTVGAMEVAGMVSSIDGRQLKLSSGFGVDTSQLTYNPLDDKGYQQIDVGDRIKASGRLSNDLFEPTELVADWIITMDRK